jgi:hypothetical protein
VQAPDFTADSQVGTISLHDLIDGGWGLLVFFTGNFDPVHTTVSEEKDSIPHHLYMPSADRWGKGTKGGRL